MLNMQSVKQNKLNNFFMLLFIAPVTIYFIQFSEKTSKYNVQCRRIVKI
jgi:hypothetical protein